MMGYANDQMTAETMAYLGYEIKGGSTNPCNSCREAKAKKEPIPKENYQDISIIPNQLIWLDLSTLKNPNNCVVNVRKITNSN